MEKYRNMVVAGMATASLILASFYASAQPVPGGTVKRTDLQRHDLSTPVSPIRQGMPGRSTQASWLPI